jgi:HK97 family phage portal protein
MSELEIYSPDEVAAIEQGFAQLVPLEGGPGGVKTLDGTPGNGLELLLNGDWRGTKSGVSVSTRTAMEIAAVMACATVVAEDVGKMPLQLYRWNTKDKTGRTPTGASKREPTHPLAKLLETRPNEHMTAQAFKETLTLHAMLWGSGYAWKADDSKGNVGELWPLMPGQCVPRWVDNQLVFDVWFGEAWGEEWRAVTVPPARIFRINGVSWDGFRGLNRVTLGREVLGLSKRLTEAQAKFYGNDQRPSGVLSSQEKISAEAHDRIKTTWERQFGPDGPGGIAVLYGGFKYEGMTVSAKDADTIALYRLMIEEACRIFRVQPVKVMHATGTQSYASIEQLNYAHLTDTLDPWLVRWEEEAERDLTAPVDPQLYWKFNRSAYLRPLPKDRWDIYVKGRQTNTMSVNQIRDAEEWEPDDDPRADDLFAPIGTNPAPGAARPPAPTRPAAESGEGGGEGEPKKRRAFSGWLPAMADLRGRRTGR